MPIARLTPYDDSGQPVGAVVDCDDGIVIGRMHLQRNLEIMSTISRKLLRVERGASQTLLRKVGACPLYYTLCDESVRRPFQAEVPLQGRVYLYHDRHDSALGSIDAVQP